MGSGAGKEVLDQSGVMSWCVVLMKHKFRSVSGVTQTSASTPKMWSPSLDSLPHLPQNAQVDLCSDATPIGDEFPVHNSILVPKDDQHGFLHCCFTPHFLDSVFTG